VTSAPLGDPVGITEIAERLGVERQTAQNWAYAQAHGTAKNPMPAPWRIIGGRTPIWHFPDVAEWHAAKDPRGGRARTLQPTTEASDVLEPSPASNGDRPLFAAPAVNVAGSAWTWSVEVNGKRVTARASSRRDLRGKAKERVARELGHDDFDVEVTDA
jgi:hypothetical protein